MKKSVAKNRQIKQCGRQNLHRRAQLIVAVWGIKCGVPLHWLGCLRVD